MKTTTRDVDNLIIDIEKQIEKFKEEFKDFEISDYLFEDINLANDEFKIKIYIKNFNPDNDHKIYKNNDVTETNRGLMYIGELLLEENLKNSIIDGIDYKSDIEVRFESEEDTSNLLSLNQFKWKIQEIQLDESIKELSETEESIFTSDEIVKKFVDLSEGQRDKPERQMLVLQRLIGGGTLSYLLEHIGDLTHRISEVNVTKHQAISISLSTMVPKINNGIRSLSYNLNGYNVYNEVEDSLKRNFEYFKESNYDICKEFDTFEKFHKKVLEELNKYVEFHSELTIYNRPQWLCRESAINIGKMQFNEARSNLKELADMIESGEFLTKSFVLDNDYAPSLSKRKKPKP